MEALFSKITLEAAHYSSNGGQPVLNITFVLVFNNNVMLFSLCPTKSSLSFCLSYREPVKYHINIRINQVATKCVFD